MADYIKSNIGSGYNAATNINTELGKIETAIASKVDEEGGVMTGDLQMNSNDILNAGQVSTNTLILDGVALTANNPVNSDTTITTTRIVATAGQTVFTVPSYSLGINAIQVFLNGVKLSVATDYAETNATTITLTNGASVNDVFEALIGSTVTDANNYDSALVTYNQGGTGAVNTNVKAKLQETVSVKDFGAVGDGVIDDTAAIQAAIDYASSDGGRVYIPAGDYACNITMKGFVHLYGDYRNTKLVPYVVNSPIIEIDSTGAINWIISDLYIEGTNDAAQTNQHGIYSSPVGSLVSSDHFEIRNVRIFQVGGYGVRFESASLTGPLTQLFTLMNVHVRDSHRSCFSFTSFTLDYSLIACHGQLYNTDSAGAYPVFEFDGDGNTQAGITLIGCFANHNESASLGNGGQAYYFNDCANYYLLNCSAENADPFIRIDGSLDRHGTISGLRANSPYNLTNMIELGFSRYLRIEQAKMLTTGTATAGIKQTSGTMANLRLLSLGKDIEITGATTPIDIRRNQTISSGKAYYYRDILDVRAEGGTADDLNYIYNPDGTDGIEQLIDGTKIIIRTDTPANAVTVKHSTSGNGTIFLNGAADVILNSASDFLELTFYSKTGQWFETGRCLN